MNQMPPLPGDIREIVLFGLQDIQESREIVLDNLRFGLQDIQERINKLEELLCLSKEEEENED
jgi:hypothetical protein